MYFIVGMVQTLNSYLAPMIYMLVFDPIYIYRMSEQVGYFEAGPLLGNYEVLFR